MSRSIKTVQVQVGQSSKEAIDLSSSGMVFLTKTVYGAGLVSSNGWGKVLGYADQACEHKVAVQLIRGTHPILGDIARAKLIKAPFKKGSTIELVLVVVNEKIGQREKDGEKFDTYDSVLRIADFKVVEQGTGEVQSFKPWVKQSGDQTTGKKDGSFGAAAPSQPAELEVEG